VIELSELNDLIMFVESWNLVRLCLGLCSRDFVVFHTRLKYVRNELLPVLHVLDRDASNDLFMGQLIIDVNQLNKQ